MGRAAALTRPAPETWTDGADGREDGRRLQDVTDPSSGLTGRPALCWDAAAAAAADPAVSVNQ